jgi:hypothetical protein
MEVAFEANQLTNSINGQDRRAMISLRLTQ